MPKHPREVIADPERINEEMEVDYTYLTFTSFIQKLYARGNVVLVQEIRLDVRDAENRISVDHKNNDVKNDVDIKSSRSSNNSNLRFRKLFNQSSLAYQHGKPLLDSILKNHQLEAFPAYSEGDCFFDSVAQALICQDIPILIREEKDGSDSKNVEGYKKLRLLCNDYVKSLPQDEERNWVKREFLTMVRNEIKSTDPNKTSEQVNKGALQKYNDYLLRLPFTHPEMEEKNKLGITGVATWGLPQIEGRIICEKLNIKLHVVKVYDDQAVTKPAHQVVDEKSSRTGESLVDYNDKRMIHIVVCRGHYFPLVRKHSVPSSLFTQTMSQIPDQEAQPLIMSRNIN